MSHFSVAVITDDTNESTIDDIMTPYSEYLEVDAYIYKTRDELIKEIRKLIPIKNQEAYELFLKDREEFKCQNEGCTYYESEYPQMANYTDQECLDKLVKKFLHYDDSQLDEDYNVWSTYNPNSKYDYYIYNSEKYENLPNGCCKLSDYKLDPPKDLVDYYSQIWDINVNNADDTEFSKEPYNRLMLMRYSKEKILKEYKTKELFVEIMSFPAPWSFVFNGEWYEQGQMVWFSLSNATVNSELAFIKKFKEIITNPEYKDYYIVFLDCHI